MISVRIVDPERATPLTNIGLIISWLLSPLPRVKDSRFPKVFQRRGVLATTLLAKWSPVGTWADFLGGTFIATPDNSAALAKYTQES